MHSAEGEYLRLLDSRKRIVKCSLLSPFLSTVLPWLDGRVRWVYILPKRRGGKRDYYDDDKDVNYSAPEQQIGK